MNQVIAVSMLGMMGASSVAAAQTEATLQAAQEGIYSVSTPDLSVVLDLSPESDGARTATIIVLEDESPVFETQKPDLFSLFFGPIVQIVEMDGRNDVPEIYISSYSGGAHCCNEISVATKTPNGWRQLDFGSFDGDAEALFPRDLNGDGQAEIKTFDNSFLYTFASYAGSFAPIQILSLVDGEVADVTAKGDFEWEVRSGLENLGAIPDAGEPRNSWLATYAAYLLILGEDDPLDYAVGAHDASVDWGMIRCTVVEVDYSCPQGKTKNIGFEAALTEFLTQTGYLR